MIKMLDNGQVLDLLTGSTIYNVYSIMGLYGVENKDGFIGDKHFRTREEAISFLKDLIKEIK